MILRKKWQPSTQQVGTSNADHTEVPLLYTWHPHAVKKMSFVNSLRMKPARTHGITVVEKPKISWRTQSVKTFKEVWVKLSVVRLRRRRARVLISGIIQGEDHCRCLSSCHRWLRLMNLNWVGCERVGKILCLDDFESLMRITYTQSWTWVSYSDLFYFN